MDILFWGVTAPGATESRRATLDLGLRRSLLFYGDLSVPGIAGTFFVRQLIWPCLAIAIKDSTDGRQLTVSTARLATAIEALACKLWIEANPGSSAATRAGRVAGIRSLPDKDWTFRALGTVQGFVSNPRRRAATRALPEASGLGFAAGGLQLSRLSLTSRGQALVKPVLEQAIYGRINLHKWLVAWIDGADQTFSPVVQMRLRQVLSPFSPTKHETFQIAAALRQDRDGRRNRLIDRLRDAGLKIEPQHLQAQILDRLPADHAAAIKAAWFFRRMLTAGQRIVREAAGTLAAPGMTRAVSDLAAGVCRASIQDVQECARVFLEHIHGQPELGHSEAVTFAHAMSGAETKDVLMVILARAVRLIELRDGRISRGPAFTEAWVTGQPDAEEDSDEPAPSPEDELPLRFPELISLLDDCGLAS